MEYFIWDGTHPSIAGHMIIAEEWLKAFNNFFEHPESFGYPKLKKKKVAEQKCTFNSQCFSGIYGNTVNLTKEYKDMRFDEEGNFINQDIPELNKSKNSLVNCFFSLRGIRVRM